MLSKSVQPRPSVVNMTLPAFAAERHAAAPLLLRHPSCRVRAAPATAVSCRLRAQQQTRRTRRCCCPSMGQTDGQTDGRTDRQTDRQTLDRFIDLATHTGSTGRRELFIGFRLNCRKYIVKKEHFRQNKLITNRPSTVSQCTGCILRRMSIHTRS